MAAVAGYLEKRFCRVFIAPAVDGLKLGYFGMLAAEDNPDTMAALFDTAEA